MVHLTRQLNTATLPNAQVDDHYDEQEIIVVTVSRQSVPDMPYASYAEMKHAERVELGRVIRKVITQWRDYQDMQAQRYS